MNYTIFLLLCMLSIVHSFIPIKTNINVCRQHSLPILPSCYEIKRKPFWRKKVKDWLVRLFLFEILEFVIYIV